MEDKVDNTVDKESMFFPYLSLLLSGRADSGSVPLHIRTEETVHVSLFEVLDKRFVSLSIFFFL